MLRKDMWDKNITVAYEQADRLYYKGKITLKDLQDFRSLIKDFDESMHVLFNKEVLALFKKRQQIRREQVTLNNLFQTFNFSLMAA